MQSPAGRLLQWFRFAAGLGQGTVGAGLPAILCDGVRAEAIACRQAPTAASFRFGAIDSCAETGRWAVTGNRIFLPRSTDDTMSFFGKRTMGHATRLLVTFALLVFASAPAVADLAGEEVLDALREGGFNIYFRHAGTDWSQRDDIAELDDTASCDGDRVRQLSEAGRAESEAAGRAIRALGIPVGEILSSPYCRCMD